MKAIKKNGYNICFTLIVIVLAVMPLLLMNGFVKSTTVLFLGKCMAFAIVAIGLDLIWGIYRNTKPRTRTLFLPWCLRNGNVSETCPDKRKYY